MYSIVQRHPFVIALSLLAAILVAVVAVELGFEDSLRSAFTGAPSKRAAVFEAKLLPPQQLVQAEQLYPEVAVRPLFTPTRRPAPAAEKPSTYTPGQFVLQGVIVTGETRTAMLREKSSGRIHRVETGREINGIRIAQIDREAVTLTQGSDREVLQLQVQRPGPPGAAGAPPPGSPGPFGPVTPAPPVPGAAPAGVLPQGMPVPQLPPGSAPGAGAQPGAPTPSSPGMILNAPNPLAAPAPGANPAASAATAAPMSPEELLARRRARRGQQSQ